MRQDETQPVASKTVSLSDFIEIISEPVDLAPWMRQYIIDALRDLQSRRAIETTVTPVAWRYKDSRGHWRYTGSEPKPEHAILQAEPLYAAERIASAVKSSPEEPPGKLIHDEECANCGAAWSKHLTNKLICPDAAIQDAYKFRQMAQVYKDLNSPEKASGEQS